MTAAIFQQPRALPFVHARRSPWPSSRALRWRLAPTVRCIAGPTSGSPSSFVNQPGQAALSPGEWACPGKSGERVRGDKLPGLTQCGRPARPESKYCGRTSETKEHGRHSTIFHRRKVDEKGLLVEDFSTHVTKKREK